MHFCCFSVQFPAANPVEVPPAPSAVRRGGAPDARSSTRVFAQGQPLCWARCPCVVIPLRVIPHVYSSTVRLHSRWACVFPWQRPSASLLCSYLKPGWLSLPQRLPYVVLPLASPYVYLHMVPTSFTQDVASVAFPYLEYAFPVLSIPTVRNSSGGHLCLSPVLSSIPTGVEGLAGFRRALEGVSNSGVFQRDPISQSHWRYVERDWLIGNVSVTYVTLVPWRREQRRNVPSP